LYARPNVRRFDVTVVDAEGQLPNEFSDEQNAENKGKAAERFLAAFLERQIVDLVDHDAEQVEDRQHDHADDHRIDAEFDIDDVCDIRAENNEARVRDIDDIEHTKLDLESGGHGGVESAEQQPGDARAYQQIEGNVHTILDWRTRAYNVVGISPQIPFVLMARRRVIARQFAGSNPAWLVRGRTGKVAHLRQNETPAT
jgi:hypothetical protein